MKSINQIFETNPSLKETKEVVELIEYCRELEATVIEYEQAEQFSKEDKLAALVRDIYAACDMTLQDDNDRYNEEGVDFKQTIINLKKYLSDFSRDSGFRL